MSGYFLKSPASQTDHAIDWARRHLRDGESVAQDLGWAVMPEGMSVVEQTLDGDRTVVTLDGGVPGQVYVVTGTVLTDTNRRLSHSVAVRVSAEG